MGNLFYKWGKLCSEPSDSSEVIGPKSVKACFCRDFTCAVTGCRVFVSCGQVGPFLQFHFPGTWAVIYRRNDHTLLRRRAAYVTCSVIVWRFAHTSLKDFYVS